MNATDSHTPKQLLEACLETLTGKPTSIDYRIPIKQIGLEGCARQTARSMANIFGPALFAAHDALVADLKTSGVTVSSSIDDRLSLITSIADELFELSADLDEAARLAEQERRQPTDAAPSAPGAA